MIRLLLPLFLLTSLLPGAARYWVGGGSSANWDATGNTNWGTASNTQDNASVPGADDDVFFDGVGTGNSASTLSASITIKSLDMAGYANTLTHNAAVTLTIGGASPVFRLASGMTYTLGNASSSAVTFTSSGTTLITTAGKTLGNLVFNNTGDTFQLVDDLTSSGNFTLTAGTFDGATNSKKVTLNGATPIIYPTAALSFYDLEITPATAAKTNSITLVGNITITGTFTVSNGATITNRVLVTSSALGTARTITAATVTVTNADFRDITGAGAGSWDLSAITGLSGDCGGNSGITFTTAQTNYWVGGTGNWSDANEWANSSGGSGGTGRVPLPQDDVVFDNGSFSGTSQTVTLDMPRAGKDIDWSGYSEGQTPTWSITSVISAVFGSIALNAGMTLTQNQQLDFYGRGSQTLTSAGKSLGGAGQGINLRMFGGTLTLQDALTAASLTLYNGTFDANDFNVTCGLVINNSGLARMLRMGSGTWTITGTGVVWNNSGGDSFNDAETSTIVISNTSATAKTFAGAGVTYNNVTFSGDNITVTGANTFANLAINTAGLTNGLILTKAVTQTVIGTISTNGYADNLAKLSSTGAGEAATISKASGTVSVDYMSIKDSTATGGATFYAGTNSTNVSGNSGWIFTAPPSGKRAVVIQ